MKNTPEKAKSQKEKPQKNDEFPCSFCGKVLKSENALIKHLCEKKQRWLNKDDKTTRVSFMLYTKFYNINYKHKKTVTMEEFLSSKNYNDFIKVGRHINDINAINPQKFMEFLITSGLPIFKWTSPTVYETYVRELTKKESPEVAVERNLLLMEQWANDTGNRLVDFFRLISPVLATSWIRSGRISPWVIYTAPSSVELFNRMTDEQMKIIETYIEPNYWQARFGKHEDELMKIKEVLTESGL